MLHELARAAQECALKEALADITKHAKDVCEWARIGQLSHGDTYDLRKAIDRASKLIDKGE